MTAPADVVICEGDRVHYVAGLSQVVAGGWPPGCREALVLGTCCSGRCYPGTRCECLLLLVDAGRLGLVEVVAPHDPYFRTPRPLWHMPVGSW